MRVMQNLCSPTKDLNSAPCNGSKHALIIGMLGDSPIRIIFMRKEMVVFLICRPCIGFWRRANFAKI